MHKLLVFAKKMYFYIVTYIYKILCSQMFQMWNYRIGVKYT